MQIRIFSLQSILTSSTYCNEIAGIYIICQEFLLWTIFKNSIIVNLSFGELTIIPKTRELLNYWVLGSMKNVKKVKLRQSWQQPPVWKLFCRHVIIGFVCVQVLLLVLASCCRGADPSLEEDSLGCTICLDIVQDLDNWLTRHNSPTLYLLLLCSYGVHRWVVGCQCTFKDIRFGKLKHR